MIDVDVGCIAERSGGVMKNVFLTQSDGKKKNLLVLLWNAEIFYIIQKSTRCKITSALTTTCYAGGNSFSFKFA